MLLEDYPNEHRPVPSVRRSAINLTVSVMLILTENVHLDRSDQDGNVIRLHLSRYGKCSNLRRESRSFPKRHPIARMPHPSKTAGRGEFSRNMSVPSIIRLIRLAWLTPRCLRVA